jgi:hypothetical protein
MNLLFPNWDSCYLLSMVWQAYEGLDKVKQLFVLNISNLISQRQEIDNQQLT